MDLTSLRSSWSDSLIVSVTFRPLFFNAAFAAAKSRYEFVLVLSRRIVTSNMFLPFLVVLDGLSLFKFARSNYGVCMSMFKSRSLSIMWWSFA